MSSYDLLKKRVESLGGNAEGRLIKQKLNTLLKCLQNSYQSEVVMKDNIEYRALINDNKLKMDYDDKVISIPYDSGFKVGDIFFWKRSNEHWLIYLQEFSEEAYFRGLVRRAQKLVKWKNKYGKVIECWGATRGPVETKTKAEMKSSLLYDNPNLSLMILIPDSEEAKILERYSRVYVNGQAWEVAAYDRISEPGILQLELVEERINKNTDQEFLNSEINSKIIVQSSLDTVSELEIGKPFKLWTMVEKDGSIQQDLINKAVYTVVKGEGTIQNGILIINSFSSNAQIQLSIEEIGFNKVYDVIIRENEIPNIEQYKIIGDEKVKGFGESKYSIKHFVNGSETAYVDGQWQLALNEELFEVSRANKDEIIFRWKTGKVGKVVLKYEVQGTIVAIKTIQVDSLI